MNKLTPRAIGLAVVSLIIISMFYFGWSLPHGWIFGPICSGMAEPYEQFMVVDSNIKSAELRAEEYARLNTKCMQISEVRLIKYVGRTPYRMFGVKQIDRRQ
ncbi:MAG: hypothetical protein AAGU16_13230 [Desulfitobacterium hafniense]